MAHTRTTKDHESWTEQMTAERTTCKAIKVTGYQIGHESTECGQTAKFKATTERYCAVGEPICGIHKRAEERAEQAEIDDKETRSDDDAAMDKLDAAYNLLRELNIGCTMSRGPDGNLRTTYLLVNITDLLHTLRDAKVITTTQMKKVLDA